MAHPLSTRCPVSGARTRRGLASVMNAPLLGVPLLTALLLGAFPSALLAASHAATGEEMTDKEAMGEEPKGALKPVTFGTNWLAQAEHGGFYQAVADGTYAECGLDVTIVPGGPQVNNRALLAAGRLDFYMGGDLIQAFAGAAQDIPFVTVAALFQKHPQVIIAHPGKAETFDDLKDLTILVSDTAFQSFYQWMMAARGFTAAQRDAYTFNPAPFLADEETAMQGYLTSEPYSIEREAGFAPDVFLLADEGYATYATTIETMRDTIDSDPDAVQCFVDGSIKGWYAYLYGDRSAGDALIKAANPEISDDKIAFAVAKLKEFGIVDSGDALEKGIGVITDEGVRAFHDQMVEAGAIEPLEDPSVVLDARFSGKGVGMELKPGSAGSTGAEPGATTAQ